MSKSPFSRIKCIAISAGVQLHNGIAYAYIVDKDTFYKDLKYIRSIQVKYIEGYKMNIAIDTENTSKSHVCNEIGRLYDSKLLNDMTDQHELILMNINGLVVARYTV